MLIVVFGSLYDALPLVPLAIALVWTLRFQKVADLSLAGSFSISAGLTAYILSIGQGAATGIVAGLAAGILIGIAMGFSVNTLRIDPLMAGLLVLFVAYAVSLAITQGTVTIPRDSNPVDWLLGLERTSPVANWIHPYVNTLFVLIGTVVFLGTVFLLSSEWGCAYRALENGEAGRAFLRPLGIHPARLSSAGFVIASLLASLSGILISLRDGQATSSLGLDSLVEVIPAFLLGGAVFEKVPSLHGKNSAASKGGRFHSALNRVGALTSRVRFASPTLAAALGVVVYFLIVNAAQMWTGIPWLPRVVIGVAILAMLGAPTAWAAWRQQRRQISATTTTRENESLEVRGLSVSYPTIDGPRDVLSEIDLIAEPGTIVLLEGPNGCGKTSLIHSLVDEIDCTGTFHIPTKTSAIPESAPASRSQLIACIPQHAAAATAGSLSIAEHACLAHCGSDVSPLRRWRSNSATAVANLGIDDVSDNYDTLLKWLSGGQARRVLLGLLNARKDCPVVVAMDEPFSHLDVSGQNRCEGVIRDLINRNAIVILVDHAKHIEPSENTQCLRLNQPA